MSVVHLLTHANYGELRVEDPWLRIDSEDEREHYLMVINANGDEIAWSLHDTRADARDAARRLAKRLRCPLPRGRVR
jgi:hypothetical protein